MSETVLKIEGLSKDYKMFARKKDRIIETLFPGVERHGVFEAMHDFNLEVKKGDVIGQVIFSKYFKVDNDNAEGIRTGGFGSTNK